MLRHVMSGTGGSSRWALAVPIVVALIGLASSTVWGPPICRAIGVCTEPEPTKTPGDTTPSFGFPSFELPGPASIFLSLTSGPAGSPVKVSGEGFAGGEEVVIRFHTTEVGRTTASSNGTFTSVEVIVPLQYADFAGQQFSVVATGRSSIKSARSPFTVSG